MSIRSSDLQVMIPKVQEVSRLHQIQQQQSQEQQQQFAAQLRQTVEHQLSTVQQSPRNEKGEIREREESRKRKEGGTKRAAHRAPQEGEKEKQGSKDGLVGGILDIRV